MHLATAISGPAMWVTAAIAASGATPAEPGFAVRTIATGLTQPVAMAMAPDERIFVAEKNGGVRIIQDEALQEVPFVELPVHALLESGLLGIALDPEFSDNHYVYLFATVSTDEQKIIRFTERDGVGVDEFVVRDRIPSAGTLHNGGCLKFGPDGKLYFSVGDNTNPDNAQDLTTFAGKICRINADGSTPDDNPFSTVTGSPRAIFALGLRNPFRFCHGDNGRLFVMDVGSDLLKRREEINAVRAGDNLGWPVVEGFAADSSPANGADTSGMVDPIYTYVDKGSAPAGCVFYTASQYPRVYHGNLFHVEYTLNRVYRVVLDGDRVVSHSVFVQGEGSPVDLIQANDGSLLYCELATGAVKEIRYVDGDNPDGGVVPDASASESDVVSLCGSGIFIPIALTITLTGACRLRRRRRGHADDSSAI